MKRIKLILAAVSAVAVLMVGAAASPALAAHGWEWTEWWQWGESTWWCSSGWFHDENDEWTLETIFCYDTDTGELWTWP